MMIEWQRGEAGHADLCTLVVGRSHLPNYVYVLADPSGDALVVDPGYEADLIRAELEKFDLQLRAVLLTHGHADHLAAVPELVQETNVSVFISSQEEIDEGFPVPNLMRCSHNQPFMAGAFQILPLVTPGHSPGSTCYLVDDRLFTGDTVFVESVGHCAGSGGDVDELFASVQFLKNHVADDVRIYPGHCFHSSPGQAFGMVKGRNVYFRLNDPESFVAWHHRFTGAMARNEG